MAEKKKIDWLSVLQGFSMLLVVIGHVSLTNKPRDPSTPIATAIEYIIYSFHMPLFIFISGWLFYYTCLLKEKSYLDVVIAKLKRLGIPFFIFTLAAIILKAAFPSLMHRPVTTQELIDTFVFFRSNPLGEMWFVIVLFELMLMYPVYRMLVKNKILATIGLGGALLISKLFPEISYFNLGKVAYMFPFFVAGILCCRFEWHKFMSKLWYLVIVVVLFIPCNVIAVLPESMKTETAFVGILFTISLCLIVGEYIPKLFSSFRDYTFQIFLMGIFFQMAIRWIFVKWGNDMLFVPMWLLSVLIGVYAPTFIAKIIENKAPKYVKMCFGL